MAPEMERRLADVEEGGEWGLAIGGQDGNTSFSMLSVLLSIPAKVFLPPPDRHEIFSDAKARKLCLSNKKNLVQPDEAWILFALAQGLRVRVRASG